MKKVLCVTFILFLTMVCSFAQPHQLPNLTPPTIGTGGKILSDFGYHIDFGEKVFDNDGDREDTDISSTNGNFYFNGKYTVHPKFDAFAELNLVHRSQSNGFDRSSFGLGDIFIGANTQIQYGIIQVYLELPLGTSELKDDIDHDDMPTGGTIYAPYGGTYNLGANFYYKYQKLNLKAGYEMTLGREFHDTDAKVNPGDCLSFGVNYETAYQKYIVGGTFEGFFIGKVKFDGDTVDDSNMRRFDLTGYIYPQLTKYNEVIALTIPLFGLNHSTNMMFWINLSMPISIK